MKKKFNYKVAVVGLGYVGLPLAVQAAKKFNVIGFDINKQRVYQLQKNYDSTNEITKEKLKKVRKNLSFASDKNSLIDRNFFIITVPTPIDKYKKPDLGFINKATSYISNFIKKGDIIIYECTVYPGITEDHCGKIISKKTGLILNEDFFMGYSPERINPGDFKNTIDKIIKVVSGSNEYALNKVSFFYKKIIPAGIFPAKNIKTAEAAKVIENIQRDLNISLINEFSLIFDKLNLNIYDVLSAAKTKWNFLNFEPGLVGGHCIGIDPYYLTYLSKKVGYNPKLILAGRETNEKMVNLTAKKFFNCLRKSKIDKNKAKILFLGLTFKENCPDLRNSKNLELCSKIMRKTKNLESYDPYLNKKYLNKIFVKNYNLKFKIPKKKYDAIIIAVPHSIFFKKKYFSLKNLLKKKSILFDIKNKFPNISSSISL